MTLTPLNLGDAAVPVVVPSPTQKSELLACGPLDLGLLNGILKMLADQIDAVDAADNAIVSAAYNAGTNTLVVTMFDGPTVNIPFGPLIADAVATGLIVSSAYNAGTNILTLTTANGDNIAIDMTAIISDSVGTALMPVGGIIMWSGSIGAIPASWALCDGTGGTPDLRDRFIVGAGTTYAVGASGGEATHNHAGQTGGHALLESEMPSHYHGNGIADDNVNGIEWRGTQPIPPLGSGIANSGTATLEGLTETVGGDDPHSHAIAIDSSLPPYYALAYIMKI